MHTGPYFCDFLRERCPILLNKSVYAHSEQYFSTVGVLTTVQRQEGRAGTGSGSNPVLFTGISLSNMFIFLHLL